MIYFGLVEERTTSDRQAKETKNNTLDDTYGSPKGDWIVSIDARLGQSLDDSKLRSAID